MDAVPILVPVAFPHLVQQLLCNESVDALGNRARTLYASHCFQIVEGQFSLNSEVEGGFIGII
jgi:hypothetical protein